jgi:hypothetical protein
MNKDEKTYSRKISQDEAMGRYIMIMKDELDFFPKPGAPFQIQIGRKKIDTHIRTIDCWCQGPNKPHMHYRIDLAHHVELYRPHFGQVVTIVHKKENLYELK